MKLRYSRKADGFNGRLYVPRHDRYPGKAVIVMGGSDGVFTLTRWMARCLTRRGMTTLALDYFGGNALLLPKECVALPVESVERAASRLRDEGFEKVGTWGFSQGAELSLLSASLLPGLITNVVSASPSALVTMGISWRGSPHNVDQSSFTWRGRPLPCLRNRENDAASIRRVSRQKGEFYTRRCYEAGLEAGVPESAVIPVERIRGDILLLSGDRDANIPAGLFCDMIQARLRERGFAHRCVHRHYQNMSHNLFPGETFLVRWMSHTERKYARDCRGARRDALAQTLLFWDEW